MTIGGLNRSFGAALLINGIALIVTTVLVATSIFPDNWILSPLYILVCSLAHRPFIKLEVSALIIAQVVTFALFPFLNWGVISFILSIVTI